MNLEPSVLQQCTLVTNQGVYQEHEYAVYGAARSSERLEDVDNPSDFKAPRLRCPSET